MGASAASGLYFLRFFRWRSVAIMWDARLPKVRKLGGKFAGSEVGIELDEEQEVALAALTRRVDELAAARTIDHETIEGIAGYFIGKEARSDFSGTGAHPGAAGEGGGAEEDR